MAPLAAASDSLAIRLKAGQNASTPYSNASTTLTNMGCFDHASHASCCEGLINGAATMSDVDKLLSELLDSDEDSEVRASVDYHSQERRDSARW